MKKNLCNAKWYLRLRNEICYEDKIFYHNRIIRPQ